jgi:hypothetical protein
MTPQPPAFQHCPRCGHEHRPGNHVGYCERCWFKLDLTGFYLEEKRPLTPDPDHPVIDRPWEYQIVGLCYSRSLDCPDGSFIDLTLQKGAAVRRLRFYGPRHLLIDEGFPSSSGLQILDVSRRPMEGLKVRVANFEAHGGGPMFWAREVVDLGPGSSDSLRPV